jgi:predicted metalloprotease
VLGVALLGAALLLLTACDGGSGGASIGSGSAESASSTSASSESVSSGSASAESAEETASAEDDARAAAEAYYAAAASGSYGYTYDELSSYSQSQFTEDAWVAANTALGSDAAIYSIESVNVVDDSIAEVNLTVNLPDGSSSERLTRFVLEEGSWKHDLTNEEYDLFAGAVDGAASASASASASTSAASTSTASGDMASAEQKVLQDANAVLHLLNEFWTQELQTQYGLQFDTPNGYEYYRGASNDSCAGQHARALPENAYYCSAEYDEYVAFDLDWFTSYLDEHPGGATTFLILAHEWGHAVQDTWVEQQPGTDVWNPSYLKELNADCLAGVWMEDALRRGTIIEESGDAEAIFEWLSEGGSGPWFAPGDHGTPEQRQLAFSHGFTQGTHYCRTNY